MEKSRLKIMRCTLYLIISVHAPVFLIGQEVNEELGASLESIMALSDDGDPEFLLEELALLRDSPVIINSGEEREISRLFFLNEFQVMVLADYVRENGSAVTLYELALLPGFDRSTVMLMAPYISLEPVRSKGGRSHGSTQVTLTATSRFGTPGNETGGVRSLLRLRHEHGRLTFGLTGENDPGEPFSFRNASGADFLSGFIGYEGRGIISRIIAGDFTIRAGEGLLFNSSRWMGSWLSSPSFMSGRSLAAPYSSTEENNFFRGVSIVLGNMSTGAVIFVSSNSIDARLILSEDSTPVGVSNLVSGGLHVTRSQLDARNSLVETIAGVHLTAGTERTRGGLTASYTWFSLPFLPDISGPENLHAFSGDRLAHLAADFRAGTGPLLFFAETALGIEETWPVNEGGSLPGLSLPGGIVKVADSWAATAGIRARPSGRVTFNMLARHLAPGYHAFHSGAFRAGSGPGNESGIAVSVHIEAAKHLFITAATDQYRVPWPRFRSSSPSYGSRTELRGEYQPRDNIALRVSYTSAAREYDDPPETGTAMSVTHARRQLGMVFDCSPDADLRLTTRASAVFITPSEEKGYLFSQDFSYSFHSVPVKIWVRFVLCSTDGWDSRLYCWENDLLSSFSVPALYGETTRSYIMISWKPSDRLEARLKYGYTDSHQYNGDLLRQELKGQVRIRF